MSSQRQEHVVERRAPEHQIAHRDSRVVEAPHCFDEARRAAGDRERDAACARLDLRRSVADAGEERQCAVERVLVGERDVEHVTAEPILELHGRPLGDDRAVVDHDHSVRELVRLLQVLRGQQHARPLADELAEERPQLDPVGGVETGGRLVEQEHAGMRDEPCTEIDPTTHTAGVRLERSVGVLDEGHALEHLGGPFGSELLAEPGEAADHLEVLATGEGLVDGRVLTREPDDARGPPSAARPHRSRRRGRRLHPAPAAWRESGRAWSCPRRSGRATRRPGLRELPSRHRRAPSSCRTSAPHLRLRQSGSRQVLQWARVPAPEREVERWNSPPKVGNATRDPARIFVVGPPGTMAVPRQPTRTGAALTRGCVASISMVEVGEASRRRRNVAKEPATKIIANTDHDSMALAA